MCGLSWLCYKNGIRYKLGEETKMNGRIKSVIGQRPVQSYNGVIL